MRDDVILEFPSRELTFTYIRVLAGWRRLLNWGRPTQRVTRKVTMQTLALRSLLTFQRLHYAVSQQMEAKGFIGLDLASTCALLIGDIAHELPFEALEEVWRAHLELNSPKVPPMEKKTPAVEEKPSPSAPLSDDSSAGPSTSPSGSSSTT